MQWFTRSFVFFAVPIPQLFISYLETTIVSGSAGIDRGAPSLGSSALNQHLGSSFTAVAWPSTDTAFQISLSPCCEVWALLCEHAAAWVNACATWHVPGHTYRRTSRIQRPLSHEVSLNFRYDSIVSEGWTKKNTLELIWKDQFQCEKDLDHVENRCVDVDSLGVCTKPVQYCANNDINSDVSNKLTHSTFVSTAFAARLCTINELMHIINM